MHQRRTINSKIIHEHLHVVFKKITENAKHAPLECARGIAYAKRHPPIGKSAKGTGEYGHFLILKSNMDFKIARKTIKKTIMRFTYQALKHLVNEWQGEVVFPGRLIEPPVVLHPSWDQFVPFIFNNCEACLLWNHMDGTDSLIV